MSVRSVPRLRGAALLAAFWCACGGSQNVSPAPPPPEDPAEFSADRAWHALESLVAVGPRPAGSDAAAAARAQIRARLDAAGVAHVEVETIASPEGLPPIALTHVVATLPGASADRFVLVAPYDSGRFDGVEFVGANQGASGAALLLELAGVLAHRDPPRYTLQFVWLEGEGRLGRGDGAVADLRGLGGVGLAERWLTEGRLDGIRMLVAFDRVCDADLRIARDLESRRTFREPFWQAARRLGATQSFAPDAAYESVAASHLAFRDLGVRPVVALVDTAFGGDEPPGVYAESEQDSLGHCAPQSLETVGAVTLEALDAIGARLAKIDRFARTPSLERAPRPAAEAAAAEPVAEPADGSEAAAPEADPGS